MSVKYCGIWMSAALMCVLTPPHAVASPTHALDVQCAANAAPLDGGICVIRTVGSRNPDVLYYLHGRNLNERAWLDDGYYTGQLRQQWALTGRDAPTVISISFGKLWVLAQKNASPASGLFEVLTEQLIPKIEAALPGGQIQGRRVLLGESMGGFNAAELALKTKLFDRAALLCAPIMEVSPFASQADIDAFIARSGADSSLVSDLVRIGRAFFPTQDDWENASPLDLATHFDAKGSPQLYVAAGHYDAYGLYQANLTFAAMLKRRGVSIDWRPQWGGHCAIDIESLAAFLAP